MKAVREDNGCAYPDGKKASPFIFSNLFRIAMKVS
jgi:hypothetical protein